LVCRLKTRDILQRLLYAPLRLLYAVWVLLAFLAAGLLVMVLLVLLPQLSWRRRAARAGARAFLLLAGMPLRVHGAELLPPGQCVVVCNHASYLDGVVLTAALPPRFGFVIKREVAAVPLMGGLLKRLGSEFVERFNRPRGASDARRVLKNAIHGNSLVFFPEGTFTRTPGLLKFHTGAFVTASRAACPVVPATVHGTRRALPPSGALPRPGPIDFQLLTPLPVSGAGEQAVSELRDRSRTAVLAALGEPDLTCCDDTDRPPDTAPARSARASRP
jgi:1-acyl-sn-glycerol-3-phosphate acyltransferase